MKNKIFVYSVAALIFSFSIVGASIASAHGMFGGFSDISPDELATRQQARFQGEAQILGVGVDEIKDAWAQGKSLKDLALEKGISKEQIQTRMKEAWTQKIQSQLKSLVDKGVISQAQADKRLQTMQNMSLKNKGRMGKRMFRGFHF